MAGPEFARKHDLPITFSSEVRGLPATDILLYSGLLQYLDIPFRDFLKSLSSPPIEILLNKVALRDAPTVFSLQRIGPSYVPYMIRNETEFLQQIDDLGYEVADRWEISALAHRITSHPELGTSKSAGFYLKRRQT